MKKLTRALAAIMLMTAVIFTVGCNPEDEPDNGGGNGSGSGNGTYNGHGYVDLGLPSGTLWATCNVGADTPEGCGDYFAWGETGTKTVYGTDNYKYYDSNGETTKYSVLGLGVIDNLIYLEPIDDAATFNWGDGWCTPSWEQWEELRTKVSSMTWVTQNGMNGWLFTGSNGNTLFLPAAGSRWSDNLGYVGNYGFYWSNQLYWEGSFYSNSVCYAYCDSQWIQRKDGARWYGNTVRPVRSKE